MDVGKELEMAVLRGLGMEKDAQVRSLERLNSGVGAAVPLHQGILS